MTCPLRCARSVRYAPPFHPSHFCRPLSSAFRHGFARHRVIYAAGWISPPNEVKRVGIFFTVSLPLRCKKFSHSWKSLHVAPRSAGGWSEGVKRYLCCDVCLEASCRPTGRNGTRLALRRTVETRGRLLLPRTGPTPPVLWPPPPTPVPPHGPAAPPAAGLFISPRRVARAIRARRRRFPFPPVLLIVRRATSGARVKGGDQGRSRISGDSVRAGNPGPINNADWLRVFRDWGQRTPATAMGQTGSSPGIISAEEPGRTGTAPVTRLQGCLFQLWGGRSPTLCR